MCKHKEEASSISAEGFLKRRRPTLPHCGAVPSARSGLTSLFGMGRGGTPRLKPPKYFVQFIIKNSEFIIVLSIYYSLLTTDSSFLIKNSVLIGIDCGKKNQAEPCWYSSVYAYCGSNSEFWILNSEFWIFCLVCGKADGLLVMLGFDVTTFTPASYQRHRLWRPCEN